MSDFQNNHVALTLKKFQSVCSAYGTIVATEKLTNEERSVCEAVLKKARFIRNNCEQALVEDRGKL